MKRSVRLREGHAMTRKGPVSILVFAVREKDSIAGF